MDIVGPLPPSDGYSYLLTIVDRFTRWPEAIPIPCITAETIAKYFVKRWVAIFGVPSVITTDRGSQFESSLFRRLNQLLGTHRIRTTAYHPAANGLVERFHRQLKASIAAADPTHWTEVLPLALLGIRTSLKVDINCSAAEMVFGTTLALPSDFVASTDDDTLLDPTDYVHRLRQYMSNLRPTPTRHTPHREHIHADLHTCTHVWIRIDAVRAPLRPHYQGPFQVIERHDKFFVLLVRGKRSTVSLDRLKPAYIDEDSTPGDKPPSSSGPPVLPPIIPAQRPKPAHPAEQPKPTTQRTEVSDQKPLQVTRSGRRVHWPRRYVEIICTG